MVDDGAVKHVTESGCQGARPRTEAREIIGTSLPVCQVGFFHQPQKPRRAGVSTPARHATCAPRLRPGELPVRQVEAHRPRPARCRTVLPVRHPGPNPPSGLIHVVLVYLAGADDAKGSCPGTQPYRPVVIHFQLVPAPVGASRAHAGR